MELNKINSLVELFFERCKRKEINDPFLRWLKSDENQKFYTWDQVDIKIRILSKHLSKSLSRGDRVVLLSENRPEWLITDLAIMNAGGVTVPLFTTYSDKDYDYIINDCKPKIFIISNKVQFKKIQKFISKETLIFSFENFYKDYEANLDRITTFEDISEILVEKFIDDLKKEFNLSIDEIEIVKEDITFKVPGKLN